MSHTGTIGRDVKQLNFLSSEKVRRSTCTFTVQRELGYPSATMRDDDGYLPHSDDDGGAGILHLISILFARGTCLVF